MDYYELAIAYIGKNGINANYDDFRDQFGVTVDAVEIFTAYTNAHHDIYE